MIVAAVHDNNHRKILDARRQRQYTTLQHGAAKPEIFIWGALIRGPGDESHPVDSRGEAQLRVRGTLPEAEAVFVRKYRQVMISERSKHETTAIGGRGRGGD